MNAVAGTGHTRGNTRGSAVRSASPDFSSANLSGGELKPQRNPNYSVVQERTKADGKSAVGGGGRHEGTAGSGIAANNDEGFKPRSLLFNQAPASTSNGGGPPEGPSLVNQQLNSLPPMHSQTVSATHTNQNT